MPRLEDSSGIGQAPVLEEDVLEEDVLEEEATTPSRRVLPSSICCVNDYLLLIYRFLRVWRGGSESGVFDLLSSDFE